MKLLKNLNYVITNFFTIWIILFSLSAFYYPNHFKGLTGLIVPTLGIIMFGMGMTLTIHDFRRVLARPRDVYIGVLLQYLLMPLGAFILVKVFNLNEFLAAGIILLGSCPGGTASNVITYLARGDLALSVTLTSVSTILSPVLIPVLMYFYASQWIEVPVIKLFISSVQIVIIPVLLGLGARAILKDRVNTFNEFLPSISTVAIIFIVGVIVAANSTAISTTGPKILLIVVIHNLFGLVAGYYIAKLFGMDNIRARTISIEVGMQNSGLAVALANLHFSALAALPAAIASVWHNISGSILAWWWRRSPGSL